MKCKSKGRRLPIPFQNAKVKHELDYDYYLTKEVEKGNMDKQTFNLLHKEKRERNVTTGRLPDSFYGENKQF